MNQKPPRNQGGSRLGLRTHNLSNLIPRTLRADGGDLFFCHEQVPFVNKEAAPCLVRLGGYQRCVSSYGA